jgi:hypothetical protein
MFKRWPRIIPMRVPSLQISESQMTRMTPPPFAGRLVLVSRLVCLLRGIMDGCSTLNIDALPISLSHRPIWEINANCTACEGLRRGLYLERSISSQVRWVAALHDLSGMARQSHYHDFPPSFTAQPRPAELLSSPFVLHRRGACQCPDLHDPLHLTRSRALIHSLKERNRNPG